MQVTNQAKASFKPEDLYQRGYKLIRDSLECGVTSMRAHVEIDTTVQLSCLHVGLKLSNVFRDICDIQVAGKFSRHLNSNLNLYGTAFAQEPLFDAPNTSEPGMNYTLLVQAAETEGVQVVGSA